MAQCKTEWLETDGEWGTEYTEEHRCCLQSGHICDHECVCGDECIAWW